MRKVKTAEHGMLTQRMPETFSIIGAGRVGPSAGPPFARTWVARRRRHDALHPHGPRCRAHHRRGTSDGPAYTPRARFRCCAIATPDRVIADVAADLAHLGGNEWRGKVVLLTLRCAGFFGAPSSGCAWGASTGSIHPMQTFSGQGVPDLAGIVFGIDGNPAALKVARKMIRQMGGVAVRLSKSNKAAYHAAGTFACANVLVLVETATRLLMSQGFKRRQAARALLALTRQTLDNLERIGPRTAWTGPMTRGDFATMQRHVGALSDFPPEYLDAYKALSRLTALVLSDDPGALLQKLEAIFHPGHNSGHKGAAKKKTRKEFVVG